MTKTIIKAKYMKTATIRCEHSPMAIPLEISEENIYYIQCQLIQLRLSPEQTKTVCGHCDCMAPKMWLDPQGGAYITIDPSQLDLKGEFVKVQPVG
jgi:hypothetical protein